MTETSEHQKRMQVRVYRTIADHDCDDQAFWMALPVAQRVVRVWKVSEAPYRLRGGFPDESGLFRTVARVHRP